MTSEGQRSEMQEHIRRRPGMYLGFGATDKRAMHQLVYEIIGNAINQAVDGYASRFDIILLDNQRISISDDGTGIPIAEYEQTGKTLLELLSTMGGRYVKLNRFSGVLFGIGLVSVNALSEFFEVVIKRDGFVWYQLYKQGIKQTELTQIRPLEPDEKTGTQITFAPDFEIFKKNEFDYVWISRHLRQFAYLVKGLTISIEDQRTTPSQSQQFHYPTGIVEYVADLNRDQTAVHPVVSTHQIIDLEKKHHVLGSQLVMEIDLAFQYVHQPDTLILSFINGFKLDLHGTYLEDLIRAIEEKVTEYPQKDALIDNQYPFLLKEDVTRGLTLVVNIWHPDPSFEGTMNYKLINQDIDEPIYHIVSERMDALLEEDEATFRHITERLLQNKAYRLQRDI